MSYRLGIDASQPVASCAISKDAEILASSAMDKPIENFPRLIREVVAKAGVALGDMEEIVVCVGPGSSTGVRAAVVTGNALALALKKPVSGVLSTDAAAVLAKKKGFSKAAVSAGRRRWYVVGFGESEESCGQSDEAVGKSEAALEQSEEVFGQSEKSIAKLEEAPGQSGETLLRVDEPALLDDIPEEAFHAFSPDNKDMLGTCAAGALLVAARQRQLIRQECLEKVLPYEGKDRALVI